MITQYEIGVIGAGNAAEGVVGGLIRRSVLLDDRTIVSDPLEVRRDLFADKFNVAVTDDNRRVVQNSYMIVLAIKPQIFRDVIAGFADLVRNDHVIVSIMAGVSTNTLEAQFPNIKARVVRVMPNLAMLAGAGIAGVCPGRHANDNDVLHARRVFEASGQTTIIEDETLMDAVTGVGGTGPAYFFYFTDAIAAAGMAAGLSEQQAMLFARQACLGAAKMMLETEDSPQVLREKVTSPGGTTQAALDFLRSKNAFETIRGAVIAACERSKQLGH